MVARQDLPLQLPQHGARFQAELQGEQAPRLVVRDQGVVLPPHPAQRPHVLRAQLFAEGVRGDQRLHLVEDLVVQAELEARGEPHLQARQAPLLQAGGLRVERRDAFEADERAVAPQGHGVAHEPVDPGRVAVGGGPPGEVDTLFEADHVDGQRVDREPVSRPLVPHQGVGLGVAARERAPQVVDVHLEVLAGAARRGPAPQRVDQAVDGDHRVRTAQQNGQQDLLFERSQRDGLRLRLRGERT
ncbi:hypothetical protein RB200_01190 [Streptomyces sp. PmtG]